MCRRGPRADNIRGKKTLAHCPLHLKICLMTMFQYSDLLQVISSLWRKVKKINLVKIGGL